MQYIRQVRVDSPGTSNEHISQVRSSPTTYGPVSMQTRAQVVQDIDGGRESYRSHHDQSAAEATVVTRTSTRGTRYITTVADGRESNNLLSLPRF